MVLMKEERRFLWKFPYLHFFVKARFTKVNILVGVKISQRHHKCRNIHIVVVIKMTKPPKIEETNKVIISPWHR